MAKKVDLQKQLNERKYKIAPKPYNWFYHLVMCTFKLKKFNPEVIIKDDIHECKGPCFIVWNHLSRLDHSFILNVTYPRPFSMVAEYNEFFRSHLAKVFDMMKILPKKNFCVDMQGMKIMLKMAQKGAWMAIAPEGLATYSGYNERIIPGLGKFLKHTKIPVYLFKFEGEGLCAPVFSPYYRHGGKNKVTVSKLFSVEQLQETSAEDIENIIQDNFSQNDYEWQRENMHEWDTLGLGCEGMHDALYKCPDCKEEFSMIGKGDELTCTKCGFSVHQNKFLQFEANRQLEFTPKDYSDWYLWQRKDVIREIRKNNEFSISCNVKIGNIPNDHLVKSKERSTELVGEGKLTLDHSGIHYDGTRNGQPYSFNLSYEQYYRLICNINVHVFALYINGEYFEFFPDKNIVGKLDLVIQEMNRLHYNTWKPLKEHEYLYLENN